MFVCCRVIAELGGIYCCSLFNFDIYPILTMKCGICQGVMRVLEGGVYFCPICGNYLKCDLGVRFEQTNKKVIQGLERWRRRADLF